MKKKTFYLLLVFISIACLYITGCGCERYTPNQQVSKLKYYVPKDFKSRSDLRGLIYNDDTRKIFAKGDVDDYSTFMYIDVIKQAKTIELKDYINDINNNNLKDDNIKFNKKDKSNLEVYERVGYKTQQGKIDIINYAYITAIDNYYYTITISGALDKNIEVNSLAEKVSSSLEIVSE